VRIARSISWYCCHANLVPYLRSRGIVRTRESGHVLLETFAHDDTSIVSAASRMTLRQSSAILTPDIGQRNILVRLLLEKGATINDNDLKQELIRA
jgi:hypothetical protein